MTLAARYLEIVKRALMDTLHGYILPEERLNIYEGRKFSSRAHTMIGRARLDNVQECCERAIHDSVRGDFVECGVWRGGACVLMRAVLEAADEWYSLTKGAEKKVWVCDSFRGLPEPTHPIDAAHDRDVGTLRGWDGLAVPRSEVEETFLRYDLLDGRVRFLEGWFRDTLPAAPIEEIAVLRLDGDLYESTMDSLVHLESKVQRGGFVIVDDYHGVPLTRRAVDDYRRERGIEAPMIDVDWTCAYWRKM